MNTTLEIKSGVVGCLTDNWNVIIVFLVGIFIYGTYLSLTYNISLNAVSEGMDEEKADFIRKKQRKGYLLLITSCLILAILAQTILL